MSITNKKIAILRGINVGGKRKILMADLKQLFKKMGLNPVKTYIQSGNVIFHSKAHETVDQLAKKIEDAVAAKYGFFVPVIVLTAKELEVCIEKNPYFQEDDVDINRLHLTMLKKEPTHEDIASSASLQSGPDKFTINGKNVFIYCADKYHKSKLTNRFFENKLKVPATTRNWKTVLKLAELVQQNTGD